MKSIQKRQAGWSAVVFAIVAALGVWALQATGPAEADSGGKSGPALVEHIDGSDLSKITLTERPAPRLDIQVGSVVEHTFANETRLVVPFGAIFYDSMGNAWVYTNPGGLTYIRAAVTVDRIEGDTAILSDGPQVGSSVVSVGAALLYGTEFGVGH